MANMNNRCCVCNDNAKRIISFENNFYCEKHYRQMKKFGHIQERGKFDLNEIIVKENYAEIILYDRYNKEKDRAIIDIEDIDKLKNIKWKSCRKYVCNTQQGIALQNLIMNFTPNKETVVDHINRNRLDCRKSNLRIVSYQINAINKGRQSNNMSGFVGVFWDKSCDKWVSRIKLNKKSIDLGSYTSLDNALKARKDGEIKYFGWEINREYDCNTVFKKKNKKILLEGAI